ncbi:MAG: hypothetical protein WCV88_05190 [Patescibacteria group bacterium]
MANLLQRFQDWVDSLSDLQKQIMLATGLIVGALIMGFLIYWVFFRSLITTTPVENANNENINGNANLPGINFNDNRNNVSNGNTNGSLPTVDTVAKGGNTLSQVIYDGDAKDVTLSGDGQEVQYYDPVTGKFYKIDKNGQIVLLDDKVFKGVTDVTWSNEADKAVMTLEDGYKVLYDFTQNKQYTLNKDMTEFDFSPKDDQIGFKYMGENSTERWVGVANVDGTGARGIEPLGNNGDLLKVQWSPSGQAIGVLNDYVDAEHKKIVPIGFNNENFKQFIVKGRGFDYKWTPSGKSMIYSTYSSDSNYSATLNIVDAYGDTIGNNNKPLELATSVDKCSFSKTGNDLYCAVPVNPPTGSGIAPDKLNSVAHDIYHVNLVTGQKEKIATPADAVSGTNLGGPSNIMVSDDGSLLYYREATSGKLRRILLK